MKQPLTKICLLIVAFFIFLVNNIYAVTFEYIPSTNNAADILLSVALGKMSNPWKTQLIDNVTVKVEVGWGDSEAMEGITASTQADLIYMDYSFMRDRMVADESQEADKNGLVRWLPQQDQFSADNWLYDPDNPKIWATQANWKALGLNETHFFNGGVDEWGNQWNDNIDASIQFNFDYFDGTTPDDRDLRTIALHELGHVLGFDTSLDMYQKTGPTTLDMFRFEKDSLHNNDDNDIPTTLDEFRTNERNMSTSGIVPYLVVDYDTDTNTFEQYMMSNTNYGRQASHWANRGDGYEIGVMDPGQENYFDNIVPITIADYYAMDLIGWEVSVFSDPYCSDCDSMLPWDHFWLPAAQTSEFSETTITFLWDIFWANINFDSDTHHPMLETQEFFESWYLDNPKLAQDAILAAIGAYNENAAIPIEWSRSIGIIPDLLGNEIGRIQQIDYKSAIPEPSTMLLFGFGLLGLAAVDRRKK